MNDDYIYAAQMAELYNLLEDDLSGKIFWARLQCDCDPSAANQAQLCRLSGRVSEEEIELLQYPEIACNKFTGGEKKLFLYGAKKIGEDAGRWLLHHGAGFYAYCARNHEKYVNGVNGKQVLSPSYLFEHPEECCVLITSGEKAEEIFHILMEHHFPQEQVKFYVRPSTVKSLEDARYFDFPELFPKGTAFVDGGCYDCKTSIRFAEWCGGEYSKIFAFEPDPQNYQKCRAISDSSGLRLELISAGLSKCAGTVRFSANGTEGSFIIGSETMEADNVCKFNTREVVQEEVTIQTAALDDVVKDVTVGLIKLDIEGAEMDALQGAEKTILRDKPLLALSVYHRCGDVLAIMGYLHKLVPEYHFWLRHYTASYTDTVLYASVAVPKDINGPSL